MRLAGILAGDIVEVDVRGRRFLARVAANTTDGLRLAPVNRHINHFQCRAQQVVGHWAKRGRPGVSDEPLSPAPRQLTLGLDP